MVNGHNWNAAIYKGMCYTAAATTERKWHYVQDNRQHLKKRRHKEKDPQCGVPQSMVLHCNWMVCAGHHWSMLKNQRSLLKSWVIRIAKQQMFGCLNGNL